MIAGVLTLAAVALRCGVDSPALIGALTAAAPDVEHLRVLERRRPRKLFPSHRIAGLHRSGGVPAYAQLAVAAALVAGLPCAPAGRRFAALRAR